MVAHILDLIDQHDISVAELREAYDKDMHRAMRVKPQYQDPESGQTWAGRGRPPRWIVDGEVTGVSRERFRIEPKGQSDQPGNSYGRTLRQQIVRDHISDVGHSLAQGGNFDSLTMEQLARATGISRASLYNHFPVKEAVIAHWSDRHLGDFLAAAIIPAEAAATAGEGVGKLWRSTVHWWDQHADYATPYLHCFFCKQLNSGQLMPRNSFMPLYRRLLSGFDIGPSRASQPFPRLARHLHFAYLAALAEWSCGEASDLEDALEGALRVTGWLD
ncbi:H-NS family nucleoid-associated regulatory protein [Pseudomonadota bacterium AL_CKDN230030165-1A_HGKHYDSX7]